MVHMQALKDRASELERQLAAQKRAAAAADKQRGEAERRAHEAEAALAGAHQELGAAQAAAAAAKKSHDKVGAWHPSTHCSSGGNCAHAAADR
jgi:hypothetical protein